MQTYQASDVERFPNIENAMLNQYFSTLLNLKMHGEFSRKVKGACKWKDKSACRCAPLQHVGDTLGREASTDTMKLMAVWN
jgi:hypothetical protein